MNSTGCTLGVARILLTAVALAVAPTGFAAEPVSGAAAGGQRPAGRAAVDPGVMAADVLVVRPVSFASTVVGAAIFLVALPVAAITGDVPHVGRTLVGLPADFTFKRKLGDFETTIP